MNVFLIICSFALVFCIFYFAPKKPKILYKVKVRKKIIMSHGLQGFRYEYKEVLEGDWWLLLSVHEAEGWEFYECTSEVVDG